MGVLGPFSVAVRYREPGASRGFVEVFESSAKDGSEINMIRIPVLFGAQEWTSVQLFFSPETVGNDCSETVAVSRRIPKTPAIGRAVLEELLGGPTDEERANSGVTTTIPSGVTVRSFAIRERIAYADFDRTIEAGGSCRVTAIRANVTRTLLQFPTVRSVVISVEGNVEEALQP
jgi:spore germination protein GerM